MLSTAQLETEAKTAIDVLRHMLRNRLVDEKCNKLVRQNQGGTFFLSSAGHEMVGVVAAMHLRPGIDWGLPYYRDRPFVIGLGADLSELIGSAIGRAGPNHSGGRMMPEHFSHKELRIPCQSSVVGSQILHAVGVAKAIQLAGKDEVVYVSFGDGATSQGDFHEAINFACIHNLRIIFCIQDNDWAISVPLSEQTSGASVAEQLHGYSGLAVHEVDGCDFEELSRAFGSCTGPTAIVAKVPRLGAHSNSDDPRKYRPEEDIDSVLKRDPIPRFEKWLLEKGFMSEEQIDTLRREVSDEIDAATRLALQMPHPDPETVAEHVFKDFAVTTSQTERGESTVIVDALNHALDEEMARDKSIAVFGQDVAHGKGGVFGVTRGLTEKYGKRCFNTPLAESTIVGISLGMALTGYVTPVAEIQFADYLWTGINQLFNELASIHYRSNGQWNCPVVLRMPCGGYIQGGPYHSQSIEAYLAHTPGLKVVIPSNALDAKRLLKTAISDPNPVLFLEHKGLYRQRHFSAREESGASDRLAFGEAAVVKEGEDVTYVGWGMMVPMGLDAAKELHKQGISVEVIDLRTIVPLDMETIKASIKKTGKLLIAHEAPKSCGFGAEISARIAEDAFELLDGPIERIGALECAVPYANSLEQVALPSKARILDALLQLAKY
ncbi:MAG: thiamine pyrophosphate-dependent enzyme [Simkaniaceae bacterium]|nr:thiamine pyrophosphate-dependent enzyme [Simkaniaceae bacterium]